MRILIAAIGRPRACPEQSLVETYQKRLGWELRVECFESNKATAAQRQQHEAEWLIAATRDMPLRIALDERGKQLGSSDFAAKISQWQVEGHSRIAFLIGGADGHTDAVRKHCAQQLSLSAMTMPHLLARAVLAEQLYRAHTIISGHPYHREG
jgi:23S rRNA (pseudouridine1915-N3)-methyltransferase